MAGVGTTAPGVAVVIFDADAALMSMPIILPLTIMSTRLLS